MKRRLWTVSAVMLCAVAWVPACSTAAAPTEPRPSDRAQATATVHGTALATTTAPTGTASATGQSGGHQYSVRLDALEGSTDDHTGTWKAQVGQLIGGDERVTSAFNNASRHSVTGLIDDARSEARSDSWGLDANSTVSFRPSAVSQVTVGVYYARGAAHPVNYIATIVIDSRDAQPITLQDLFTNKQDGLNRLSERSATILGIDSNTPGLRATDKNFANWIPTAQGFEIHFADYQLGHGLRVTTIPWSDLADLLTPNMNTLTQS
ncbi:Protein of uncharacterised function (DUF3298) [Mycobacteroides abscessus subsp. massiliense]|uniref:RsiV family protein n=1 Tax=Mycobacteroides abscessus TaxID=36809 RepID=UPI0009D13EB8|nr:RsiV family protein [Mycobacteroides abscessus]SKT67970.1 Protein of uncharacterised function (DUF3298) [Mycobacteroides abscessus subsp. massiliense]